MFEDTTAFFTTAIIVVGALAFLLIVWTLIVRTRWGKESGLGEALEQVADAKISERELESSLVSEQIEERVKEILAEHGIVHERSVDFGTSSDGSLEMWIDEKVYTDVSQIPDKTIRNAVTQAVEEFNRPVDEPEEE
jgi:hypothetical protein